MPAPTAVVATARITRIHGGSFGPTWSRKIPRIAGGAGSVTKFKLTIGRDFTYKGKKQSYLTASCPTGHYYTEGKSGSPTAPHWRSPTSFPAAPRDS